MRQKQHDPLSLQIVRKVIKVKKVSALSGFNKTVLWLLTDRSMFDLIRTKNDG